MMKFFASIRLNQHPVTIGGILFVIALTASSASATSQPLTASTPTTVNSSIPSSSPPSLVSSAQDTATTKSLQQDAVRVIQNYYQAIDRQDYRQAYSAWEGNGTASQQSFEQFRQGFFTTAYTAVTVGEPGRLDGAAGSMYIEIPVTITAVTTSGTRQEFRGSYLLRRVNNVPGSTSEQRQWHLYSANIAQAQ